MMTFPLPGANWSYLHSFRLVATTGTAGVPLQNATPNILTWTAPDDGEMHRVLVIVDYDVTSAATGGRLDLQFTDPSGIFQSREMVAPSGGAGFQTVFAPGYWLVQAGQTVFVAQTTALTAGAATVWAEIWAY